MCIWIRKRKGLIEKKGMMHSWALFTYFDTAQLEK